MKFTNQSIPVIGLDKLLKKSLSIVNFTNSILALESLVKQNSSILIYPLPAEVVGILEINWQNMGNPYLNLYTAKQVISTSSINDILTQVRNKLLDFMLEIDSEYGNLTEIKDLSDKSKEISKIMNQTIINNTGDGNVLNTGENAKIKAQIKIKKNNLEELKSHLKEIGVPQNDTIDLIKILNEEEANYENGTFGEQTNIWIQKMFGKALNGTWEIGIGSAGTLLAEAIKAYLGM